METLYLVSALLGATILLGQTALVAFGVGHHGDFGHDADADSPGADSRNADSGDAGGSDADSVARGGALEHAIASEANHFFGVLSFRTATAALAFFGLAGMAATTAGLPTPEPLLVALAAGGAAMYGVYYLMRALYRLNCDGAQRIERAIGREAVVYLSIPAAHGGSGKIHLNLQNRLMEVEAVTPGGPLATGASVVVTGVLGSDRVEVAAIPESSRTPHV